MIRGRGGMADALVLGTSGSPVQVRVLSPAPEKPRGSIRSLSVFLVQTTFTDSNLAESEALLRLAVRREAVIVNDTASQGSEGCRAGIFWQRAKFCLFSFIFNDVLYCLASGASINSTDLSKFFITTVFISSSVTLKNSLC